MGKNEYYIEEGKVRSNSLVLDVVKHCNLSCRGCGHLSPVFKKSTITVSALQKDLNALAHSYHTKEVLVLGGEPLLHDDLVGVLNAINDSGVGDSVKVLTNGLLLDRMGDEEWALTDEVRVSVYPGINIASKAISNAVLRASESGSSLSLQYYDRFRESTTEIKTDNPSLVRRIFNSCLIAHKWHCNTVEEGYFFKCPQAYLIPKSYNQRGADFTPTDGIKISEATDFPDNLLAYLVGEDPLSSCSNCLGTVGNLMPHEQVVRLQWRGLQQKNAESMVDYEHLHLLESGVVQDVPVRYVELVKSGIIVSDPSGPF